MERRRFPRYGRATVPLQLGCPRTRRSDPQQVARKCWVTMSMAAPREPRRDSINVRTPLQCPVCGGALSDVLIRDLGGITADITWQVHAGKCADHGWFQTEVVSRPPREIFSVTRPFGAA